MRKKPIKGNTQLERTNIYYLNLFEVPVIIGGYVTGSERFSYPDLGSCAQLTFLLVMFQERNINDYIYKYDIQTRVLDQSGGHLNNSSYLILIENAVDMFMVDHDMHPHDPNYGRLVRSSTVEYLSVVEGWPNPVTVGIGCKKIGNSSIVLEFGIFQDTTDARALASQVFVFMNRNTLEPDSEAITPKLRAALERMYAEYHKFEPSPKL